MHVTHTHSHGRMHDGVRFHRFRASLTTNEGSTQICSHADSNRHAFHSLRQLSPSSLRRIRSGHEQVAPWLPKPWLHVQSQPPLFTLQLRTIRPPAPIPVAAERTQRSQISNSFFSLATPVTRLKIPKNKKCHLHSRTRPV